jgi:hypothetical protein
MANGDGQRGKVGSLAAAGCGFGFALLQGICNVYVVISGVRLVLGLGALSLATGVGATLVWFHSILWLRVTLTIAAVAGAVLALLSLRRVQSLRRSAAGAWRRRMPSARELRRERVQAAVAWLTLGMVLLEEAVHWHLDHSL